MDKMNTSSFESYQSLLVEYASGTLDEAHALVVATHISISRQGRDHVARYETLGGSLLSGYCPPAPMKQDAFSRLMERVEAEEKKAHELCREQAEESCRSAGRIPGCLETYVKKCGHPVWKSTGQGIEILAMPTRCTHSCARMIRLAPGARLEMRTRFFRNAVLVLEGTLNDGNTLFARGDLAVLENGARVSFIAHEKDGSLCLVVCRAPKIPEWLRRFFLKS